MPIQDIVTAIFVPLVGLATLFIFVVKNTLFDRRKVLLFSVAVILNAALLAANGLDYLFEQSAVSNIYVFRRITTFLYYALVPVVPFLWAEIAAKKRLNWLFLLPIAANFAFSFASIFVKLVFFVTPVNTAIRGDAWFFSYVVIAFYLAVMLAELALSGGKSRARERLFMIAMTAVYLSAIVLEGHYGYRFMISTASGVILMLYYLFLNVETAMIDPLTGCYNFTLLRREVEKMNRKEAGFIALVDLVDFKSVNDLYGREAGDKKLVRFVALLRKNMTGVAKVYRADGDKFVLISKKTTSKPLLTSLEAARIGAGRLSLRFDVGVIEYRPTDDIEDIIKQADNVMYANKSQQNSGD